MSTKTDILTEKVREDFGAESDALVIISYVLNNFRPDAVDFITPSMISQTFKGIPLVKIKEILQYLCGDRMGLFSMKFGVFDEYGTLHDISQDDIREYLLKDTPVVDPRNGELLNTIDKDVVVYFSGTDFLRQMLEKEHE